MLDWKQSAEENLHSVIYWLVYDREAWYISAASYAACKKKQSAHDKIRRVFKNLVGKQEVTTTPNLNIYSSGSSVLEVDTWW